MIPDEHESWIVWNPLRNNPQKKHQSFAEADAEAQRLAKKHIGERFYVCHVERVVFHPIAKVQSVALWKKPVTGHMPGNWEIDPHPHPEALKPMPVIKKTVVVDETALPDNGDGDDELLDAILNAIRLSPHITVGRSGVTSATVNETAEETLAAEIAERIRNNG